jgi:hypothetical protein
VRKAVRFYKGSPYRTAPHIKAKFGSARLVSLYYFWVRNGKSAACFASHYTRRPASVTPEQMCQFLRGCGKSGTVSFSQAARQAGFDRDLTLRIRSRLTPSFVRRLKAIFKERRQDKLEALADEKAFRSKNRRRLAADAVRNREIQRLAGSIMGSRGGERVDSTCQRLEAPVQATGAIFKGVLQEVGKRDVKDAN